MNPDFQLPDRDARRSAASRFDRNLVVIAGAGTGKTSLLVERLLTAIGSGSATVQRIAAITFTEKAAGEMRERLATGLDRLHALACGEPAEFDLGLEADRAFVYLNEEAGVPAASIVRRSLAAMEQLDQARVSTIHSFCSELLREFPFEARIDPDFSVDSGENAEALRLRLWEQFLVTELGPQAPRAELWREVLERLELRRLWNLARGLAEFAVDDELLGDTSRFAGFGALFGPDALELAAEIERTLATQTDGNRNAIDCLGWAAEALRAVADEGPTALRGRSPLASSVWLDLKKRDPAPGGKLAGVVPEEITRLIRSGRKLLQSAARIDDPFLARVAEALAPYALEFTELFLRSGFLGFDALLVLARNLLRDRPEIRERMKSRFQMVLVDEFQDTDPVQSEIVLFLSESLGNSAVDAMEASLAPGKLFVVGDPKQSIYRFRGADFSAYRKAIERIESEGGRVLDLVANFRSLAAVVDPINLLFDGNGWEESNYQPRYIPIVAVERESPDEPAVELWTIETEGTRAAERREAEGRVIAAEIDRLVARGACEFRGITILFRAFTNLPNYLRALRERGIPFVIDGGREFLARPEVAQLMATLRALSQPSDPAALLAFLRSPAGGVSDPELADYAGRGGRWNWRLAVDGAVHPTIADRFGLLRDLHDETRHLPADSVVHRTLARVGLLPLGAAAYEGPQRVANLTKLAAAAAELARDGSLSLEEVVDALREGRLAGLEMDRPLADDAAEAVRITSIHKMKGLENEWIFLPDLARGQSRGIPESEAATVATLPDGSRHLALRAAEVENSSNVWRKMENEKHEDAEEQRVLYVGLTRARSKLVLLAGRGRSTSRWIEALRAWDYDREAVPNDGEEIAGGLVRHRRMSPLGRGDTIRAVERIDTTDAVAAHAAAVETAKQASTAPFLRPSDRGKNEESEPPLAGQLELFADRGADRNQAKSVGTALHRLMQGWTEQDDEELITRLDAIVEEMPEGTPEIAAEARRILDGMLASPLAAYYRKIEKVGRELPILLRAGEGRRFRGFVDLLYRDDQGRLVVADYKTDVLTDESVLREKYGEQLAVYAEAVRTALGVVTPRTELWSLRDGKRIELNRPTDGRTG